MGTVRADNFDKNKMTEANVIVGLKKREVQSWWWVEATSSTRTDAIGQNCEPKTIECQKKSCFNFHIFPQTAKLRARSLSFQ